MRLSSPEKGLLRGLGALIGGDSCIMLAVITLCEVIIAGEKTNF